MAFLVIHGFRTQLFCILRKNLTEGRYAEFRRQSESILYRFFLPQYILLGLRLDCGILSQDKEEVLRTIQANAETESETTLEAAA